MFDERRIFPGAKAILAGAFLPHEREDFVGASPLEELAALAKTKGLEVVGEVVQKIQRVDSSYYMGKGKAESLKELVEKTGADLVLFDSDLSPSQMRNLEKLLERPVVDRSELILHIFADHARTKQAKLQVQLAQMQYMLPRLKRMWSHLSRTSGELGVKGPGEKQLEMDRRVIKRKITELKREIRQIQERRRRQAKKRKSMFTVALVGYTNAGKSTLMRALTGAEVLVEDKLFATLDTKTKIWPLHKGKRVLLSDTVGFISKIPPHLIASFHATLEEVAQADLLLHVVDVSYHNPWKHIQEVESVLKLLGVENKPCLLVLNKVDKLADPIEWQLLKRHYEGRCVTISALTGEGLENLREEVLKIALEKDVEREVCCREGQEALKAFLHSHATILSSWEENGVTYMKVRIAPHLLGRLEELMEFAGDTEEEVAMW